MSSCVVNKEQSPVLWLVLSSSTLSISSLVPKTSCGKFFCFRTWSDVNWISRMNKPKIFKNYSCVEDHL